MNKSKDIFLYYMLNNLKFVLVSVMKRGSAKDTQNT